VRVLRVCPSFEPPGAGRDGRPPSAESVGGLQHHAAALTRALDRRGVEQTVLTRGGGPPGLVERVGAHSVVVRVALPLRRRRGRYLLPAALAAPLLAARADVVHVHASGDCGLVAVGVVAARLARARLVVTLHCSLRHTLVVDSPTAARLKRWGAPVEGWAVRRADGVVCLTGRVRDRLASEDGLEPARLHVIPSGWERTRFDRSWDDPLPALGRPRVAFCGRLEGEKDVRTLVRAFARLRDDAQLVVAGDGSARSGLEELAVRLGVAERVRFLGFVAPARVPALLAHVDVLALPSRFEELGTAVVEALRAGVPVVASDVGGLPEVVGDAGLLHAPGDAEACARGLAAVLGDRALAARLAAAGRRSAPAYDWELLAGRVLDEVYAQ
jgi:glycosyltransferase involved in cell wall biosynthesis